MTVWLKAIRCQTLVAAIIPVFMGAVFAYQYEKFHFLSVGSAFLAAIFIQIGTNFANDYFDYINGADTDNRLGPLRVTSAGLVSPTSMRNAMIIAFIIALLCSSYIIWRGGMVIIIIAIVSILFGVLYTGGPYPLGYYGFGDIFVFLFFGPVAVAGTYYVQTLEWSVATMFLGIAPGLFSMAILAVNNLRDVDEDSQTGKRTLAVRWGPTFVRIEYVFCLFLGSTIPFLVDVFFHRSSPNHWVFLTLIPCFKLINLILVKKGGALNLILSYTARVYILFFVLWILGEFL